jgi:hypothetical protein
MQMLVLQNNIEDGYCPSPGLYTTIRSSSLHDQNLTPFFYRILSNNKLKQ